MIDENFLKRYINTPSPVGFEFILGGQVVWLNEVKKYTEKTKIDTYGNIYAYCGDLNANYTVILDAHGDEISWLVSEITKGGFLKVVKNGGSDLQIAPSTRVNVWLENGIPISGVFGHPPIHISERPEKIEIKNLFIDVGARTYDEVISMGIEVGNPITPQDGYMGLGDNFITGRALDDKLGGYINLMVLKKLKENNINLPYELIIINSVQEEIGLKGAAIASFNINPDVALIVDVCHAEDSPAYKSKQYLSGDGTILTVAPSVHNKLLRFIKKILSENNIKYKMMSRSGSSGTNTDSYAYPLGCPSSLFSIPLAYMHTTVETVHKCDIQSTIDAIYNTLINLSPEVDLKYDII